MSELELLSVVTVAIEAMDNIVADIEELLGERHPQLLSRDQTELRAIARHLSGLSLALRREIDDPNPDIQHARGLVRLARKAGAKLGRGTAIGALLLALSTGAAEGSAGEIIGRIGSNVETLDQAAAHADRADAGKWGSNTPAPGHGTTQPLFVDLVRVGTEEHLLQVRISNGQYLVNESGDVVGEIYQDPPDSTYELPETLFVDWDRKLLDARSYLVGELNQVEKFDGIDT